MRCTHVYWAAACTHHDDDLCLIAWHPTASQERVSAAHAGCAHHVVATKALVCCLSCCYNGQPGGLPPPL